MTLEQYLAARRWRRTLEDNPGGIVGTHTDGGEMPVAQHEWHPDHAPSYEILRQRRLRSA